MSAAYDGGPCHALGVYLDRQGSRVMDKPENTVIRCPTSPYQSSHGAGYSVNMYLAYDTYLGDHVRNEAATPMLTCGMTDYQPEDYTRFNYTFYPWNLFGWSDTGDRFMGKTSVNHPNGMSLLLFDSHAAHQPVLGTITDYRNAWTWSGG